MIKGTDFFKNIKIILGQSSKLNAIFLQSISRIHYNDLPSDSRTKYCRDSIVRFMTLLKLLQIQSINACMDSQWKGLLKMGKDVLYKVKNNPHKGIRVEKNSKDISEISCFIVDDTDIEKRGKSIEWIGRIFSHVSHKYSLGMKSLNLAYWSGKHLVHVDFSYHVEMGKKKNQGMKKNDLQKRYTKERPANSPGVKRIEELQKKKSNCAISMIRRALRKGMKGSYILADSWFFNSELAQFAIKEKVHLISRPKFNNWKYSHKGRTYTIGGLIKKMARNKKVKWNRNLRMRFVKVQVQFKEMNMSVMYYNNKKRGGNWNAIITTDTKISAQKAYKIYQTRWAIENSYKELKQHLRYGKCMSRDFDGQISDATQCLMAYNTLSQIKAVEEHQSIGKLFNEISKQWLKPNMMQKFWKEFYTIIQQIAETFAKPVEEMINLALNSSKFVQQINHLNSLLTTET